VSSRLIHFCKKKKIPENEQNVIPNHRLFETGDGRLKIKKVIKKYPARIFINFLKSLANAFLK